jgi:hypothetical protein
MIMVGVILWYVLPLILVMLFSWLFSTQRGIHYDVGFAFASYRLRIALLIGFGILILAAVLAHFLPAYISISGYPEFQAVLTAFCVFQIGWISVARRNGKLGRLRRGFQSIILMIAVMVWEVLSIFAVQI